jgi:hypothetical protein
LYVHLLTVQPRELWLKTTPEIGLGDRGRDANPLPPASETLRRR